MSAGCERRLVSGHHLLVQRGCRYVWNHREADKTQVRATGLTCERLILLTRFFAFADKTRSKLALLSASASIRVSPGTWVTSMSRPRSAAKSHSSRAQAAKTGSRVLPVDRANIDPILSVLIKTLESVRLLGVRVFTAMTALIASSCEIWNWVW